MRAVCGPKRGRFVWGAVARHGGHRRREQLAEEPSRRAGVEVRRGDAPRCGGVDAATLAPLRRRHRFGLTVEHEAKEQVGAPVHRRTDRLADAEGEDGRAVVVPAQSSRVRVRGDQILLEIGGLQREAAFARDQRDQHHQVSGLLGGRGYECWCGTGNGKSPPAEAKGTQPQFSGAGTWRRAEARRAERPLRAQFGDGHLARVGIVEAPLVLRGPGGAREGRDRPSAAGRVERRG